ncbi:MAG: tyrosine-protein phosphatase [Anaerolineales bacterium]|nr:tyrosine-protein phosphatase [Anaerolineales bacterium]
MTTTTYTHTYPLTAAARRVVLQGAYNVRHVGGYATGNGRFTRAHAFFRADSLHAITPADTETLLEHGIQTIIDLRDTAEQTARPNRLAQAPGVDYHHVPLYEHWNRFAVGETGLVSLSRYNELLLARCQAPLRRVFGLLAERPFPALVHCAVGKDRTGLVAGMVLDLAGVPRPQIMADYSHSFGYLTPVLDEWRARAVVDGFDAAEYEQILRSPPEVMAETLAHLKHVYGGTAAYLAQIGLSAAELERIRERVLD